MVYEYLSEQGWVDFHAATETITTFFRAERTELASDDPAALAVADLMHLNAAEATLAGAVAGALEQGWLRTDVAGVPFYLEVPESAARFAIDSTDSGPFVGHDPRQARRFWDVTLLSSDASKLAWLSGTDSLETLRGEFVPAVTQLAERYRALPRDPGIDFPRLESLPAQATLWRAKMAVLLEEQDFADSLLEVYRSFGEPAGAA